jgi:predicted ABC-type ATPase
VAILTIFAGPNGSGKSSIIGGGPHAGSDHLLEADAIALRIYPDQPQLAAIAAGREVLRRAQEYLSTVKISRLKPRCREIGHAL